MGKLREFKGQSNDTTHDPRLKWLDNTFNAPPPIPQIWLPLALAVWQTY
jgi:hypothetical protein